MYFGNFAVYGRKDTTIFPKPQMADYASMKKHSKSP